MLPEEIFKLIGIYLDYTQLPPYFLAIGFSPDTGFWQNKAEHDFQISIERTDVSGEEIYIKMAAYTNHLVPGIEKYLRCHRDICQIVWKAAKIGNFSLIEKLSTIFDEYPEESAFARDICLLLTNLGKILAGNTDIKDGILVSARGCFQIAQRLRGLDSPATNNQSFLFSIAAILSGQVYPIDLNQLNIYYINSLVGLAAIFNDYSALAYMKNIINYSITIAHQIGTTMILELIALLGNDQILSQICQDNSIPIYVDLLYVVIKSGNIYTIDRLIKTYKFTVDSPTFKIFLDTAHQIATTHNDQRMITILNKYNIS